MKHIWRIITFTRELWPRYIAISLLSVLIAIIGLVQPLFTGWAIDELKLGTEADVRYLILIAVAIFLSDFASTLVANANGYIGDRMAARLQWLLSQRYYEHLLHLPQEFFDKQLTGKLINRLNRSVVQLANFMHMWSNNFLQFVFSTVLALGIIAYYSWGVAILLFALYPIFLWMTVRSSGKWQAYQKDINNHNDIASGRFAESISQVKVVKSYLQEKRELSFFNKHQQKISQLTKPQSKHWHVKDIQRRAVLNVIFFGVYSLIFWQAAHGTLSPGQAVTLILYSFQIRIPIFTISFLVENTQRAVADSKDYFDIISTHATIVDTPHAKGLGVTSGSIGFDNVSFAYDEKPVLNKVSFAIQPNTKTALVGESGEGKTTITNLLLRLYEPQSGIITIDDQSIADVTQASLRSSIAVVFQEPALFSGTIHENIGYAMPSASLQEIETAAKAANAHEFIKKLENGYETEIGERGLKLSGGQKQRIAIARALLKNAPILVLDEATSSLDSRSEQMVQEALERLMKNRTTLIIAHRLSTIAHVDQIITLRGGRVDEMGSPAQLSHSGGIYEQLLEIQAGSATAKKQLQRFDLAGSESGDA